MIRLSPMSIVDLINRLKNKNVICFGAGIQGQRAGLFFHIWGLDDSFIAFADNDCSKHGRYVNCLKRKGSSGIPVGKTTHYIFLP